MGLWVVVAFVAILVAVAGVDETLRLFAYIDLQLRYAWIQFRMERMRRKLRKQLGGSAYYSRGNQQWQMSFCV